MVIGGRGQVTREEGKVGYFRSAGNGTYKGFVTSGVSLGGSCFTIAAHIEAESEGRWVNSEGCRWLVCAAGRD